MVVLWLLLSWSHRDRPPRTEGEKEARSGITNAWEAKFARTGEVLRIDQFDGFITWDSNQNASSNSCDLDVLLRAP